MHAEALLIQNDSLFQNDIHALIRAFFPSCTLRAVCDEDAVRDGSCELFFAAEYRPCPGDAAQMSFLVKREKDTLPPEWRAQGETEFFRSRKIENWSDRLRAKNQIKKLVYEVLALTTERELPWGTLTGIRPVHLVSALIREGRSEAEILRIMRERWLVSPEKASLALEIATREERILGSFEPQQGYSLYIGIPFCPSICQYCSFGSHPLENWRDETGNYLAALEKELCAIHEMMAGKRLDTIYIGGGTPTSLEAPQLERLLTSVDRFFSTDRVREYSVEAGRPDTIDREKLRILRAHGVDRISVNPQTMQEETLRRIGRAHTPADTVRAFGLAREEGFDNINMDMIVGLPGEGENEVRASFDAIRSLRPDSLTVHSLALKRAARLRLFRDTTEDFENSGIIMDLTRACAAAMGMAPYYLYRQKQIAGNFENVGYAIEGKECLYNIAIMEQRQTILAAGSGASSRILDRGGKDVLRVANVKDLREYLGRTEEMIERKREVLRACMSEKDTRAGAVRTE